MAARQQSTEGTTGGEEVRNTNAHLTLPTASGANERNERSRWRLSGTPAESQHTQHPGRAHTCVRATEISPDAASADGVGVPLLLIILFYLRQESTCFWSMNAKVQLHPDGNVNRKGYGFSESMYVTFYSTPPFLQYIHSLLDQ